MTEPRNRPRLLDLRQLVAVYPAIKLRTLRYWVQKASPRQVSQGGRRRTLPGNGLEAAIIRKGRIVLLDEDLFLAWLYKHNSDG
jgi:hypothetical protein